VLGLLGLGLAAVIRSSAGAIASVLALLFLPPILVNVLPHSWNTAISPYVPMQAGEQIYLAHPSAGGLGAWAGFGVFCLYAAVALVAGFFVISRRDA
jgi:ABC-2 type transport system permease protein